MNLFKKLALTAIAGGCLLAAAAPASAQYYEPYGRPPPPYGYERRPPPPDGYYRRPGPPEGYQRERRFGQVCVTSRGTCGTRPGPIGISCRCDIPGFGPKRGSIE